MTVQPMSPDAWSQRVQDTMNAVQQQGRTPGRLYATLANSPSMLEAWVEFATRLRNEPSVPRALRELVIMRVAVLTDSPYELRHHTSMAAAAGVPASKLEAIADWSHSTQLTERETAALQFCEALVTEQSLEAAGTSLKAHFPPSECVELIVTISFYLMVSRVLKAMDID
jgi:AhpD family alkylhydroperoxidase